MQIVRVSKRRLISKVIAHSRVPRGANMLGDRVSLWAYGEDGSHRFRVDLSYDDVAGILNTIAAHGMPYKGDGEE